MASKQRVVKATLDEKQAWREKVTKDGLPQLYPLYGWLTVHGQRCPVEKLPADRGGEYELHAPDDHHFDLDGSHHTILATDLADLYDRVESIDAIVACGDGEDCQ